MGLFKRIFGICETKAPSDGKCWKVAEGKVEIELARVPELQSKEGAIRLEGGGLPERVLVVHGTDGRFYAFRNNCTHFGRRIDPLPGQPQVRCCSLSKSTFDYRGERVSGPARRTLTTYKVEVENGVLIISL